MTPHIALAGIATALVLSISGLGWADTAPADPLKPIEVGPRETVGKQGFAEKQGKNIVGGIIGGLLGGSKSGSDSGPRTRRDPTRKQEFSEFHSGTSDLEAAARTRWTDDGLLISTLIKKSDDKGTFQQVFLQDCSGRRLYPVKFEIYKIWSEASLTVSWSKTTTSNGRVISQESGGWSDSWKEGLGGLTGSAAGPDSTYPAIWQQAGFDRAQAGLQQIGTYFNFTAEELQQTGSLAFVAHITRPGLDPVMTEPVAWLLEPVDEEQALLTLPDSPSATDPSVSAWDDWSGRCVTPAPGDLSGPGAEPGSEPGSREPEPDGSSPATAAGAAAGTAVPVPGEAKAAGTPPSGRETRPDWGGEATGKPPCEEAITRVEKAKKDFEAHIDDPLPLLGKALAAARQLGQATAALGRAQAHLAAEQARLDAMESYLEAWDSWSEETVEKRAKARERINGSREPDWAKGSDARYRKRHQEASAGLRARTEAQRQTVQVAQGIVTQATANLASAKSAFARSLADFLKTLKKLRGAKDLFTEEVTTFYRCSPCETIAKHFASAARLNDLLDRIRGMLEQARASASAQHAQAQAAANAAQAAANTARTKLEQLESRRSEIEQEMRDAVDTSDGCLSFEPQEGGSWMDLSTMDNVRGTTVPEGSAMGWRSNFKGSIVRVYTKPGCLKSQIEKINWRKVNELNRELTDLQSQLAEAGELVIETQRQAGLAQAEADGLKAEIDAIDELFKALAASGIEQNTEDVLAHLGDLSKQCNTELKKEIERIKQAKERKRKADERIAGAGGTRDSLHRRAGAASDALDDTDTSSGTDEDKVKQDELKGKADDLKDRTGSGNPPVSGASTAPAPESPEDAKRAADEAEDEADEAEDYADDLEDENEDLEDEIGDLEDDVAALAKRQDEWRRYWAALAHYHDCLKEKQKAIEELAELNKAAASELGELAKIIGDASDALEGAASSTKDISSISKKAKAANEKAASLADALSDLSKAMKVLDSVMRRDDLKPSEKLKAMSDAFELLRKILPELPGVSEMLEFYNEAMKAIAGKIAEIEDAQIKAFADLALYDESILEGKHGGIWDEVRKLVKLRKLMKILTKDCGNPPIPPSSTLVYSSG